MPDDIKINSENSSRKIKCVVWDLDNTIWDGTILESGNVSLREGILDIIRTLDSRGILQSIASKNEYEHAIKTLREFGISEYFIYPQINWEPKSASIKIIAQSINIGLDSIAFIDDQAFERDEVGYMLPQVLCVDASDIYRIPDMPEMIPRFITEDAKIRRSMYLSDIERKKDEEMFSGPQEEFLETLGMVLTISPVGDDDLKRAEELTVRTHQLNSTGYTYSYEELDFLRKSGNHKLLVAGLKDKYGKYGKIGLVLMECSAKVWTIKLLLMSCRVMSRGIGTIILNFIMRTAKMRGVKLQAEFVMTDRNRIMYITYKFAGFKEVGSSEGCLLLENDLNHIQDVPQHIKLIIEEDEENIKAG